jgi:hypothetical protein
MLAPALTVIVAELLFPEEMAENGIDVGLPVGDLGWPPGGVGPVPPGGELFAAPEEIPEDELGFDPAAPEDTPDPLIPRALAD